MLAGAIGTALYQRERTGTGLVVDTSLLAAAVWTLAPDFTTTTILKREPEHLNMGKALANPLVGSYQTADGRWLMLNNMDDTRHWEPVCRALGLDELIDDPRYVDTAARAVNCESLHQRLIATIASAPLAAWKPKLDAEDTVWSVMASPLEVIDDPQVAANGYLAPHPDHPTARLPGYPAQFDDKPHEIRRGAPDTGQHTDEVLAELGVEPAEIERLRSVGAVA
jgi:crotonobetainyl-CoA:carnitine CoA-transferase CaiB-like acyl-CoA transferase